MQTDTLFNVKDKVAIITGGSGILCGAMAKALAERGAKVGILGRTPEKNATMVAECRAGKEKAFNALIGQAMKATRGKANPQRISELFRRKIG